MYVVLVTMKKSYYLTLAALIIAGVFWYTDSLRIVDIPVSGVAPYYHGNTNLKQMSLTINVDWGAEYLPLMLDILQQKGVRATFFFTGTFAEKYPNLVKRTAEKGHEIGNHGYSHVHPNQLSQTQMIDHLKKSEQILLELTGKRTTLYAPPYGEYNKSLVQVANDQGYRLIMWTADTIDWQRPTPEVINSRIMKKASNGGIVLMHPIQQTVQALPVMIDQLKQKGYQLVTVSENLQTGNQGESNGSE